MGGEDGNLFTLALDQSILFPLAQGPADGVKCGASHLRQILPGEGEVDQNPIFDFYPCLVGQTQQGTSDPSFDSFCGYLPETILELLDVLGENRE